jgi:hypothetical protein
LPPAAAGEYVGKHSIVYKKKLVYIRVVVFIIRVTIFDGVGGGWLLRHDYV